MSGPEERSHAELDGRVREGLDPEFRVVRVLGRGSMASVYLARERAMDRMVAIKVLDPGKASDQTARRRFEREARSAGRIRHTNVTAVHQVGRLSDGVPYLVMEYVDGRNLEDALRATGPMSLDEAQDAIRQLAAGLAAAHEREIIHRDLKAANVLRENATGRIVLTDFGVAAVRDAAGLDTTRLTMQGQLLTDMAYVAPEHLLGEELTEMADVYGLGVLAYEILTGEGPYPPGSAAQLATAHLRVAPRSLRQMRPDVDPALAELLEHCLAKKPEHRPTAARVAAALERGAEGIEAVRLQPQTWFEAFFDELRRRRVYRVAVAYMAVAIATMEGTEPVYEALEFPAWSNDATTIALLAGFPVAVILAWMFDIRAGRITRTQDEGEARRWGRIALVLSLLVAAFAGWLLLT